MAGAGVQVMCGPRGLGSAVRAAVLVVITCLLALLLVLGELALSDYVELSNTQLSVQRRVAIVWNNGDHLHYAVHLAAGRVLDLCPCTQQAADAQYWRASYHARSQLQLDLLTSQRPTTPAARAADTLDLATWGAGWSVGELARLAAPHR